MLVVEGLATFFDVDDTLVMWGHGDHPEARTIHCPKSKTLIDGELRESPAWSELVVPNKANISQLVKHKQRGHRIIVWSAGGADWAEAVVRALDLTAHVDMVVSKPSWFYDDLTASEFMPEINRVYKKYP
jgi:hypothetical protein